MCSCVQAWQFVFVCKHVRACVRVCVSLSETCVHACVCVQVRKYVMEEVNKAGKSKKLRGFEMIKSVWLDEEPWSGVLLLYTGTWFESPSCSVLPLLAVKPVCLYMRHVIIALRGTTKLHSVAQQMNS